MSIVLSRALALLQTTEGSPSRNAPAIGWRTFATFDSVVADSEDESYPVVNLTNGSTAVEWRSLITDTQHVTVTTPGDVAIDYLAFVVHNLASVGATLSVEVLIAPDTWETVVDEFVLAHDDPTIVRFEPVFTSGVRLKIVNASSPPRIAVLYVGPLMRLPRNIYVGHTPINYGRHKEVTTGESERGDFLGRIVTRRWKESSVNMRNIPPDWYRTTFLDFVESADEYPFFWAWRPGDYPMEVGYCWTTDDVPMSNERPNGMVEFSFAMAGLAGRGGIPIVPADPRWVLRSGVWTNNGVWRTDLSW